MDIPALSMALSQINLQNDVGVAMLSKSLETYEDTGAEVAKMLELSVTPEIGGNFDVSV